MENVSKINEIHSVVVIQNENKILKNGENHLRVICLFLVVVILDARVILSLDFICG